MHGRLHNDLERAKREQAMVGLVVAVESLLQLHSPADGPDWRDSPKRHNTNRGVSES